MSEIWQGLDELDVALRRFQADVQHEVAPIVERSAREMYTTLTARFPEQDGPGRKGRPGGNLRRGNRAPIQYGPTSWLVRNFAPHAHLYEFGYDHVSGGRVEGRDVFVPAAVGIRERMGGQLDGVIARVSAQSGGAFTGR